MKLDSSFGWQDVWAYYNRSTPDIKEHLEKQTIGDGWLYGVSGKIQFEVLQFAPRHFVDRVRPHLKADVLISLGVNPYW